jgi:4a-hydroxytetrahydrobiopterin dehydratase
MKREILDQTELNDALGRLGGWTVEDRSIKKRFSFDNFAGALSFVNRVAELAEAADHHPDITFGWGYAEIALTTHDRGGITDVDVHLAKQIDEL